MATTVKHKFHTAKADGTDVTLVKPTNWNDSHDMTTDTSVPMLLGANAAGPVVELPQSSILPASLPVGAVIPYAGVTPPSGWLMCHGQAVSRSTYAALFSVCGGSFGNGDGSTTFNVPDMMGRVPAGPDNGSGRLTNLSNVNTGSFGGQQSVGLTVGHMPSHNHVATVNDPGHDHPVQLSDSGEHGGGAPGNVIHGVDTGQRTNGNFTGVGVTISNVGGTQPHTNIQPTLMLTFIIKH